MDSWAEYFEDQISWPPTITSPADRSIKKSWSVNLQPPSTSKIRECIYALKHHKDAGSDDLPQLFSKMETKLSTND